MIINLEFDAAAQSAPVSFRNTLQQAANMLDAAIADNITVDISVDYSGNGGGAYADPTFWPGPPPFLVSYQTVYNYLTQHASPDDTTFIGLPNASSINDQHGVPQSMVAVWPAQARLMGLLPANATDILDGSAHFSTDIAPNSLLGVALHEFGHVLGRVPFDFPDNLLFPLTGANLDGVAPDIFDLFRYTSPGNRLFSGNIPETQAAYFSLDGGLTRWANWGMTSDPSDSLNDNLTANDPFNEFYTGSTFQYLTPFDLEELDSLGYHLRSAAPAVNAYDFSGNGAGDILLQNTSGQIVYADMVGGRLQGFVTLANTPGWTLVGHGNITGGRDSDVVIENTAGQILYGNVVNGTVANWVSVYRAPGYNVVGVADINRDGHADIVLQNPSTGEIIVLADMANGFFNGPYTASGWTVEAQLPSVPGWTVRAVADLTDDGFPDIVIQNSNGAIAYANMANGTFNGWVDLAETPGWTVVGAGDVKRDGYADIVIQNASTGEISYGDMHNGVFGWVGGVGSTPGWNVIAVEDVIGNGFDDIVIKNSRTHQLEYANMTGGSFQGWVSVSVPTVIGQTTLASVTTSLTNPLSSPGSAPWSGSAAVPTVRDSEAWQLVAHLSGAADFINGNDSRCCATLWPNGPIENDQHSWMLPGFADHPHGFSASRLGDEVNDTLAAANLQRHVPLFGRLC